VIVLLHILAGALANGEDCYSGVALTCFALVAATVGIKQGRRQYANNMMRLRGEYNSHDEVSRSQFTDGIFKMILTE
jgi:hypothetical protein